MTDHPDYPQRLLDLLLKKGNRLPRTYGFEYEFLSDRILHAADLQNVRDFIKGLGYTSEGSVLTGGEGSIVFEPGGQIEYLSPPILADDSEGLQRILDWISRMNSCIREELDINYVGRGYFPGRFAASLLLTDPRYVRMHDRFHHSGTRGPDMMKGTAAIHMHAAITSLADLEIFYPLFTDLSSGADFGMSPDRRTIWDNTDHLRCGLPAIQDPHDALSIAEGITASAMEAVELSTGKPFCQIENSSFDDFLVHLTTMFTDVRLNAKGGTLELRTPDSRPVVEFPPLWEKFVNICEDQIPDSPESDR